MVFTRGMAEAGCEEQKSGSTEPPRPSYWDATHPLSINTMAGITLPGTVGVPVCTPGSSRFSRPLDLSSSEDDGAGDSEDYVPPGHPPTTTKATATRLTPTKKRPRKAGRKAAATEIGRAHV